MTISLLTIVSLSTLLILTKATDCTFASSYPRQYVAYKTDHDLVIDGKLDDSAWQEVGFTEDFVDISTNSTPWLRTNAKIRWDDTYLYVGGLLQENSVWANISFTCHCIDPIHDQVIFHDNDFETFIDTDGSTHYYKETEFNAANASWDLCLNKPYNDGGYENSSRVYGPNGWDMQPPLHGATYTDGIINDPASHPTHWSIEIAFPLDKLIYNTSATVPPQPGQYWRINFSRVEWAVKIINNQYQKYPSCQSCPVPGTNAEDNWVWSPQGSIAMHLPENWGFLQFADGPVNGTAPVRNPEWTVRSVAMALYYAEHAYASANNNTYTSDINALLPYTNDPNVLNGYCTHVPNITLGLNGNSFNATINTLDNQQMATIRDDRYLRVYQI